MGLTTYLFIVVFAVILVVAFVARGVLQSLAGLHNLMFAGAHQGVLGIKIVSFGSAAEADRDNSGHMVFSHSAARAPNTWPGPTLY